MAKAKGKAAKPAKKAQGKAREKSKGRKSPKR